MEKHNIIEGAKLKFFIVYDSNFDNREKVAGAIGEAVTPWGEVKVLRADKANPSELSSIDFLIVGSPTHAGRATRAVKEFLKKNSRRCS
jgi:flavorubredoxin